MKVKMMSLEMKSMKEDIISLQTTLQTFYAILSIYAIMKLYIHASPFLVAFNGFRHVVAQDRPTLPLSINDTFSFDILVTMGVAGTGGSDISPVLWCGQRYRGWEHELLHKAFLETCE